MKTTQMTPFFSATLSALPVCNIHFWIWKYLKFFFKSFYYFGPFWSVKYQIKNKKYRQKLLFGLNFLENRHPKFKVYIIFCLPAGAKYSFFCLVVNNNSCGRSFLLNMFKLILRVALVLFLAAGSSFFSWVCDNLTFTLLYSTIYINCRTFAVPLENFKVVSFDVSKTVHNCEFLVSHKTQFVELVLNQRLILFVY